MDLELDLIKGGRGTLASKKIVVASSPHKKSFENPDEGIHAIGQRAIGGANLRDSETVCIHCGNPPLQNQTKIAISQPVRNDTAGHAAWVD